MLMTQVRIQFTYGALFGIADQLHELLQVTQITVNCLIGRYLDAGAVVNQI